MKTVKTEVTAKELEALRYMTKDIGYGDDLNEFIRMLIGSYLSAKYKQPQQQAA